MALMKLSFHPGTNMAQAMAETIGYVTRSRAFMPPGTVSPFIMRFDVGSVPPSESQMPFAGAPPTVIGCGYGYGV